MPVNTASCRTPASQDSRGSAQVCGSGTKKHCTRSQPIIVIQTSLQSSPPGTATHSTRTRTQHRKSRGAGAYIPRVDTHTLHADAMARSGGNGGSCQTKRSRFIAEDRESAPQLIPGHVWCSSRHLLTQTTLNVQVQGRSAWVRGIVGVLGESIADDGCDDRVR